MAWSDFSSWRLKCRQGNSEVRLGSVEVLHRATPKCWNHGYEQVPELDGPA